MKTIKITYSHLGISNVTLINGIYVLELNFIVSNIKNAKLTETIN